MYIYIIYNFRYTKCNNRCHVYVFLLKDSLIFLSHLDDLPHPLGLVHQCYLWWQAIVWSNWVSVRYFGQKLSGTQNLPEKHRPQLPAAGCLLRYLEISWCVTAITGHLKAPLGPSWSIWPATLGVCLSNGYGRYGSKWRTPQQQMDVHQFHPLQNMV